MQTRFALLGTARLSALLAVAAGAPLGAQAHLVGHVRDSIGRGLGGAQVMLEGTALEARTDSVGTFRLLVPPATYSLLVRHVGYRAVRRAVTLARTDTVLALITLAVSESPELDTVVVRADLDYAPGRAGFNYRRRVGFGSFIDSTELRKNDGRELSSILRRVPGLKIVQGPPRLQGGTRVEWAAHPVGGCFVAVMLDNVFLYRGIRGEVPPDLRKEINTMDIEAVEYYRGGGPIPSEFSIRHADCGVLVLWTRRGQIRR
jgi:hypothetical protein